ncbi:hypothetical protein [Nocardioides sp.]|uniref:hypothetical protein n=1 Tax=Nocardioides sp. TaxID=35761 RepID=UPI003785327C
MSPEPTEDWPQRVFAERLVQPDRVSCGATCLVMARLVTDAGYGERLGAAPSVVEAFREEVLAMHRRVTSTVTDGRWQVPWPRALGTPPWAVAGQLGDRQVHWIRTAPAAGYDAIVAAVRRRQPVPVYVGSRWLPRHVVLALGEEDERLRCYEPARGHLVDVSRADFRRARLGLAGWDHAWWAVLPR